MAISGGEISERRRSWAHEVGGAWTTTTYLHTLYWSTTSLAISSTIRFNDPTSFVTERFKHFVVVTMLGKLVVTVHSQPGEDLRRDRSPPSLSPLVVLSLPPRRHPRP